VNEDSVCYELNILSKMIGVLPDEKNEFRPLLLRQLCKVLETYIINETEHKTIFEDLRLEILSLQFDLDATRKERDDLRG
jgi:hypothetical protein